MKHRPLPTSLSWAPGVFLLTALGRTPEPYKPRVSRRLGTVSKASAAPAPVPGLV